MKLEKYKSTPTHQMTLESDINLTQRIWCHSQQRQIRQIGKDSLQKNDKKNLFRFCLEQYYTKAVRICFFPIHS